MRWVEAISEKVTISKNTLVKNIYTGIPDTTDKFSLFCEELRAKENDFLLDIFILLNYSVLEGEYINNNFSEEIEKLISLIDTFFQFPDLSFITDTEEEGKYTAYVSEIKFLYSFKQCLEEYSKNQKFIDDIIRKLDKILVFNLSDRSSDIIDELKLEKKDFELILSTIFLKNLTLSRKEFTLRNDEENLEGLLNLNISFKECQVKFPFEDDKIKTILSILIDKTTFLIRKLIIRKNQEVNSENHYYVASGVEKSFLLDDHPLVSEFYKKWDEYSQLHYLSDENEIYKRRLKSFNDFENTYWQKHRFLKIAKDFDKKLSSLEDITLDNIEIDSSTFDKYSKKISENYIKNCILSLSVEKEEANISLDLDFEKFINFENDKIDAIQSESVIKNFFPYKKVCQFVNKYIDFLYDELKKKDSLDKEIIEKLKKANAHLDKFTKKYKTTLNWCSNHFYYAYQLPSKECYFVHENNGISLKIFSPSTFSLPLDHQSLVNEIKILEGKIENVKNEIRSLDNFYSLFNRLENKLSIQEEILENNTKKNIEMLGIFSAIIALLFQGVNTVNSNIGVKNKLLTFVMMFVMLFSFLFMIRLFFDKKNKLKKVKYWFELGIFLLMFIILLIILSNI